MPYMFNFVSRMYTQRTKQILKIYSIYCNDKKYHINGFTIAFFLRESQILKNLQHPNKPSPNNPNKFSKMYK